MHEANRELVRGQVAAQVDAADDANASLGGSDRAPGPGVAPDVRKFDAAKPDDEDGHRVAIANTARGLFLKAHLQIPAVVQTGELVAHQVAAAGLWALGDPGNRLEGGNQRFVGSSADPAEENDLC